MNSYFNMDGIEKIRTSTGFPSNQQLPYLTNENYSLNYYQYIIVFIKSMPSVIFPLGTDRLLIRIELMLTS